MEYIITTLEPNGKREILSKHTNLDDALAAGKLSYEKLKRHISCISGTIDENGKVKGEYKFYRSWS